VSGCTVTERMIGFELHLLPAKAASADLVQSPSVDGVYSPIRSEIWTVSAARHEEGENTTQAAVSETPRMAERKNISFLEAP